MGLLSVVATAWMAVGQVDASAPARVAVVNVPIVSERYQKTGDLEAQFKQKEDKFKEERDALRGRIERLGRSLQEELKPGTETFNERRKQLALLQTELEFFVESEGQKTEAAFAQSLRAIYDDIHRAVREVAEERGIDMVLATDQLPNEPSVSAAQTRQQIMLQKVLYWSPRLDLTDEVTARLNANYRAQRAAPGGGTARPPVADEALTPGE